MRRRVVPALMRIGRKLRAHLFAPEVRTEVDEEFSFHVEMRARELEARGLTSEEAREEAMRGFGEMDDLKEACRRLGHQREARMMGRTWLDELGQDVRFSLRHLRKNPAVTAVTVLTLGVGMGANTAVFGVVKGVLLSPLPFQEPDRLVQIWTRYLPPSGFDIPQFEISAPEILDYRGSNSVFETLGYYSLTKRDLTAAGTEPVRVPTVLVNRDVLPTLGVEPAIGRWIRPEEDLPGASPVVLLTHDLWTSRFGADPAVVGRTLEVSGRSALVAGVMPEGFAFPDARYDLIENLGLDEGDPGGRAGHGLVGIGRLKPGVALAQVEAEAEAIHAGWAESYPHNVAHFPIFHRLVDDVVGEDVRRALLLLMGAVGVVLLIAIVNVANLLLARGEGRQREIAVRNAMGAGRSRLVRQLLTESLTLAALGAALGLGLAHWGTAALLRVDPTALPRTGTIGMDVGVLLFTGAVTVATAMLFGLAPALQAGGATAGALGSGERGGTASVRRTRFRRSLVAVEVGLSVVVVLAAGLIARSFQRLTEVDPGVRTEGVLTFEVSLPSARYPDDTEVVAFFERLRTGLSSLPGVRSAAAVSRLPLSGNTGRSDFRIEGRETPSDGIRMWNAEWAAVLSGYFETAGIEPLAGRVFTSADGADAEPVVILGAATARLFFAGEDPMGERVALPFTDAPWARIVGVVGDTRTASLDEEIWPQIYFPQAQAPVMYYQTPRTMGYTVRTSVPPESLSAAVRTTVAELDPNLPLSRMRTLEDALRSSVARPRMLTGLLGGFALVALLLAAVGVYGVASYSVVKRTREIGIRMAIGAERAGVSRLMVKEGVRPALVGVLVGVPVAFGLSRLMSGLLFEVSPSDPATFLAVPALLVLVALASSWLPARRATRVDPAEALRSD